MALKMIKIDELAKRLCDTWNNSPAGKEGNTWDNTTKDEQEGYKDMAIVALGILHDEICTSVDYEFQSGKIL